MNVLRKLFPIVIGGIIVAALLAGLLIVFPAFAQGPGGMWGQGMMGWNNNGAQPNQAGPGWMMGGAGPRWNQDGETGTPGYGPGWMMGYTQGLSGTAVAPGPGWMNGGGFGPCWGQTGGDETTGYGPGWMRGGHGGMMGGFGPRWGQTDSDETTGYGPGWMMGGRGRGGMMWSDNSPFAVAEPLTVAEVETAINDYLAELGDSNLALEEIMIFDNHAYVELVEKDSGIGAMELLVDPATKTVYPEMGPNMMWNLKYGMMAGYGPGQMMGGRFGFNNNGTTAEVSADMPVTPAEAVEAAQAYLDANYPAANLTVEEHAEPFYGYYTLHLSKDGQTAGMLSVNGYNKLVFPHTWHGQLLEMSEIEH